MENQFLESQGISQTNKRPTFLTVLCILSWIGCAIGLWNPTQQLLGPSPRENLVKMAAQADKMDGKPREIMDATVEFMSLNIDFFEKYNLTFALLGLASVALCIHGTIQMWNLKRSGFFFYLAGELLPLLIGFVTMFMVVVPPGSIMGTFQKYGTIFGIVISAAFIIMYGVNLKHLKK